MESKNIKLNLTKREIETIQIALTYYLVESNKKKVISRHIEEAKALIDNIDFYIRQKNEE